MKENFKDMAAAEYGNSNWIDTDEANKIAEKAMENHPDVSVLVDKEHFVIKKDDKEIHIPRWRKIPVSKNSKDITGHKSIEEAIEKAIGESEK